MRARLRVTGAVMTVGCAFALLPLWAAHAEPSAGEISVSLPARIVLDGSVVPVSVSADGADPALDVVAVGLYDGSRLQAMGGVEAGGSGAVGSGALSPGTLVARATLVTASCDDLAASASASPAASPSGSAALPTEGSAAASTSAPAAAPVNGSAAGDGCEVDASGHRYRIVDGLVRHDSASAVAKYGSKVSLRVARTGATVRWTAHAKRWNGSDWVGWSGAAVRIGAHVLQSDARGVAVLTTRTKKSHALAASVAGTATVWPATSRTATSTARAGASSTAATAAEQAGFRKALERLAG